jgi:hypothetical protein
MNKHKFSLPMIALAIITLILSSYGLFRLAHDFGDIPASLAIIVVGGFDLFAIAAGHHALAIAEDGDSSGAWNLAVIGAAVLSAVLQYAHTQLAGQPWPVGVMMAMFPLATVGLFEGTLRRAHRLNGRAAGRVAEPRASFELLQWIVYPKVTWMAFRLAVVDRTLGPDAAFKMGFVAKKPQAEYRAPKRRELDLAYDQLVPGFPQLTSGLHSGEGPDGSGESADKRPDTRPLTALIRESLQVNGADEEAVYSDVKALRPDAKEDTIRRTIRKEAGPRSA